MDSGPPYERDDCPVPNEGDAAASPHFAPWVEPIALALREGRAALRDVAAAIPDAAWRLPSPAKGRTYQDLLAHVAVSQWLCQTLLAPLIIDRNRPFKTLSGSDVVKSASAVLEEEQRARSIPELLREVATEGDDTEALLAKLNEADDERRDGRRGTTLSDYLRQVVEHDRRHLIQLRTALESRPAIRH
jgi:hypothetical protein